MIIRPACEADLPKVLEIEAVSYPAPWPETLFRGHLGEEGFLVGEVEGQLVGYIVVGIKIPTLMERLEKRTRWMMGQPVDMEERHGHIMNIAIAPQFRCRGLAKKLLERGLSYLKSLDAECAELEVRVSNQAAIKLYESFGFEREGIIPKYYQNGEDGFFMSRLL